MSLVKTVRNILKHETGLITPRMELWMSQNPELEVETPEEEELLLRLMRPSANSIRHSRFGASSRGTCERRQVFAYLGMPSARIMDPALQNIFWDGKLRHIKWQLMGFKAGIFTDVEVPFAIPEWRSSISLDAMNDDEEWLFELKGMSNFVSTMTELKEEHMLQVHTYFFLTGWDTCVYLVEDKRTQVWKEIVVRRNEEYIRKVRNELERLNTAVEEEVLPRVIPECRHKKGPYKECPYAVRCINWERDEGDSWPDGRSWESGVGKSVSVGRRVRASRNEERTL